VRTCNYDITVYYHIIYSAARKQKQEATEIQIEGNVPQLTNIHT
jgi:hypothetical protein